MKQITTFCTVCTLALLLSAAANAAVAAGSRTRFSMHSQPRPVPEVEFRDGAGRTIRLSDFRGKVVVLNLWATWCGPCRKEMPTLDRLQARLGGADFQVVALSADAGGLDAVRAFFKFVGIRHLATYNDQDSRALSSLDVRALPTTLLLDRNGAELGRLIGPAEWDSPRMLRFLRNIIGAKRENRTVGAPRSWLVAGAAPG